MNNIFNRYTPDKYRIFINRWFNTGLDNNNKFVIILIIIKSILLVLIYY
jgi:hypothetical protein